MLVVVQSSLRWFYHLSFFVISLSKLVRLGGPLQSGKCSSCAIFCVLLALLVSGHAAVSVGKLLIVPSIWTECLSKILGGIEDECLP